MDGWMAFSNLLQQNILEIFALRIRLTRECNLISGNVNNNVKGNDKSGLYSVIEFKHFKINFNYAGYWSLGSSVGIATRLQAGRRGLESQYGK
jgi:hypothetical protein